MTHLDKKKVLIISHEPYSKEENKRRVIKILFIEDHWTRIVLHSGTVLLALLQLVLLVSSKWLGIIFYYSYFKVQPNLSALDEVFFRGTG